MGKHKPKNPKVIEKFKQQRKLRKQILKEKRARLVVRNLPFTATEENLRKHYEQFGEVANVTLLKKPDGKLVGCGFIQFKLVQKAAKARHHTNGKPFLGREIICDWALAKDKYEQKQQTKEPEPEIKKENEDIKIKVEIKEEPEDTYEQQSLENADVAVKDEPEQPKEENVSDEEITENTENNLLAEEHEEQDSGKDEESETEEQDIEEDAAEENDKSEEENDESEEENDESEEETDESDKETETIKEESSNELAKKPHVISNDVTEGKTVFVKNVPFSATNEDLKTCMLQFGPVYYALICIDKFTEHSKGTAFVKFRNQEDAEKCLQAGTELTLMGNILDCHKALSRTDLQTKSKEKEKTQQRDSRNLYLVKEGVILAGSKAAEDVSAADMAKRLQLEQYKTQMLRKLNMYVSRERLIVHNLPASWDDSKLRALFAKHAGSKAIIREARIMRDMKSLDSKGIGRSKEYGFVTFVRHEDALKALRSLNNNPNIFSASKRPIVAFSIENKSMVKAKEKRLLNSKLRNPKCKEYNSQAVKTNDECKNKKRKLQDAAIITESAETDDKFAGIAAKPGVNKMRSRYNLKTQAKLHHESLKKQKKKLKFSKKTLQEKKKEFIRQPQQKVNKKTKKKAEKDNFSALVNSYKQTLLSASSEKKARWYE